MKIKDKNKLKKYPTPVATLKNRNNDEIIFLDEFARRSRSVSNLATRHYIHSMSFDIVEKGDIYHAYDFGGYQHIRRKKIKGGYKTHDDE